MNDSNDETKTGGFRVQDKRRFDDVGNERDDQKKMPEKQAQPAEKTPASGQMPSAAKVGSNNEVAQEDQQAQFAEQGEPTIDFGSFIISLATQSLMQMGEMQPPPGMQIPLDLDSSQQTIDIIAMLHEKTKGNLNVDEERMMTEVLHNLRLAFIRRGAAKPTHK